MTDFTTRTVSICGSSIGHVWEAKTKADAFNTYFTTVFNADTSIPSNLPSSPYTHDIVSILEYSHEEVLSPLNSSETPGLDNLNSRILKECANELTLTLLMLNIQQVVTYG
jgi:hypothetical protein